MVSSSHVTVISLLVCIYGDIWACRISEMVQNILAKRFWWPIKTRLSNLRILDIFFILLPVLIKHIPELILHCEVIDSNPPAHPNWPRPWRKSEKLINMPSLRYSLSRSTSSRAHRVSLKVQIWDGRREKDDGPKYTWVTLSFKSPNAYKIDVIYMVCSSSLSPRPQLFPTPLDNAACSNKSLGWFEIWNFKHCHKPQR